MPNDNNNKPISFGRAKADKTGKAHDWTVKDALEFAIEQSEDAEMCVIVMATKRDENNARSYHYVAAVPEELMKVALVTQAMKDFNND